MVSGAVEFRVVFRFSFKILYSNILENDSI